MPENVCGLQLAEPFTPDSGKGLSLREQQLAREQDARLVGLLQAGDEAAYETLLERFETPVYNLVYRLMDDPSEASDVVQEVFLKVFRKVGSFRGDSSLKTWIYRIAVNEAYNHRRWFGRHRRQEVGLEKPGDEQLGYQDLLPDPGRCPFEQAATAETRTLIEEALTRLNANFRAAVVLRDIEDLSYEEVAAVLQVSLGTVKSRILRGREALRDLLAERLEPRLAVNEARLPVSQALAGVHGD
jgi:RNA polymerase sigma-70 factor (ECF subfamily)